MKIALLAPSAIEEKVKDYLEKEHLDIQIFYLTYNDYKDVIRLIKDSKQEFDAILFGGLAAYSYAKKTIEQRTMWYYFPRHVMSFLNALLKASYLGYDILNISCDTYSKEYILEAYNELGIPENHVTINQISDDALVLDDNDLIEKYNEQVIKFHKKNYFKDKKTCIITGLNTVHNNLKKEGIFSFTTFPTTSVIRETFNSLLLKYTSMQNQKSQIVILSIEIDLPSEYSVISQNEYQYLQEKNKVLNCIYSFAEDIKAAVVEATYNTYLLFSTKSILETQTDNYNKISLLDEVSKNSLNTLSIGIGYGQTAQVAKYNANMGMLKSKTYNSSIAYIIYENNVVVGPIKSSNSNKDDLVIDSKLSQISNNSQISVNKVFMIYNLIHKYKKDCYTSKELSSLLNISTRSVNRTINKLESCGYCQVIGKKVINKNGRPSRIIKFNI